MDFDAADNVVNDNVNSYSCDAEGRICAFSTPSGTGGNIVVGYLYDANGARVAKGTIHSVLVNGVSTLSCDPAANGFQLTERYVLGQGGEELTMLDGSGNWQRTNVYGAGKQLATYDIASNPAHTSTNGLPATAPALHFQLTDPLGTRRMQTNADGQPETDIQSLPFGDGLSSAPDQYAPVTADDATPLHFTGKERDSESGNDYFGARYYASTMARFLSPDWAAKAEPVPYAKLDNPQSLNLYAYVLNNPLGSFDPDGHFDCAGKDKGSLGCNYNDAWNAQHGLGQQQQNAGTGNAAPKPNHFSMSLGGTAVNGTFNAFHGMSGAQGVTITANPQDCDSCRWSQVVTRTGSGEDGQPFTDREGGYPGAPLYPPADYPLNKFNDQPWNVRSGTFSAVTVLGISDFPNSRTFQVKGAFTYGYGVDGSGNLTTRGPRVATPAQLTNALKILREQSSTWSIQ